MSLKFTLAVFILLVHSLCCLFFLYTSAYIINTFRSIRQASVTALVTLNSAVRSCLSFLCLNPVNLVWISLFHYTVDAVIHISGPSMDRNLSRLNGLLFLTREFYNDHTGFLVWILQQLHRYILDLSNQPDYCSFHPCEDLPAGTDNDSVILESTPRIPNHTLATIPSIPIILSPLLSSTPESPTLINNHHDFHNDKIFQLQTKKHSFMDSLKIDMIPIGEGGFGQVFRAIGVGGNSFAVKFVQRASLTQDISIVNEVTALKASAGSPWVVKLECFEAADEQALIVLDYLPGGDMHNYWERAGFRLEFNTAMFYIAQLLLAIHDLHKRGIIHRDIKLENLMLNQTHNLQLVDFGLAQVFNHNTVSKRDFPFFHQMKNMGGDAFPLLWATNHNPHQTDLVNGTEGYAPPEVWKGQMHSFGIDYFAMGCVMHLMLTGNVPFEYDSAMDQYDYEKIKVDRQGVKTEIVDFLSSVLAVRPMSRLNVRKMKLHSVFRGIDWKALAAGKVQPPLFPDATI